MEQQEIVNKLFNSEAIASLDIEKAATSILQKHKWNTIRSPYYIDTNTGKYRELDIIGNYRYVRGFGKALFISSIALLVECKSLKNSHIVVDGDNTFKDDDSCDRIDLLEDYSKRYIKITRILNKTNLDEDTKMKLLRLLEKWSFPRGYSTLTNYKPETYNSISRFSAFRETTIGTTKDLDNSVLWKSFLSLKSASDGYSYDIW
jgi:hypothetical protein